MGSSLNKVLVVDDDRFAQKMVVRALEPYYEIRTADNGIEALKVVQDWLPDAIVLDVEMPLKNGYETCEALKSNPVTAQIPVIFLSGNSSVREKMLGFELGADDYLVKPFEPEMLQAKVRVVVARYLEKLEQDKKHSSAQETVFEALSTSAELGRVLRFVEYSYSISDFDVLATAFFQTMNEFGLKTSVMFVTLNGPLFFSHNSVEVSPLERDLLQAVHQQGRFKDFGCRTFCNYRQVSLLIKNMPLDNMERYGRIKDTVPFILGAVDGKIRSLDLHQTLLEQADSLGKSVDFIGTTLTSLTEQVNAGHQTITDVMKNLLLDLDERLPKLGLEEDQEKYLVDRIDKSFREALAALDANMSLASSLSGVIRLLTHLHSQQQKMVQTTATVPQDVPENLPNDGATLSSDFELF